MARLPHERRREARFGSATASSRFRMTRRAPALLADWESAWALLFSEFSQVTPADLERTVTARDRPISSSRPSIGSSGTPPSTSVRLCSRQAHPDGRVGNALDRSRPIRGIQRENATEISAVRRPESEGMTTRKESDSMGEIEVATDRYWGAQTERSLITFTSAANTFPGRSSGRSACLRRPPRG